MEDPPLDSTPVALKPETYARHAAAVEYVEGLVQTRAPWPGTGRFPGLVPGAWASLASGHSISAASGSTLGSGDVTLCSRSGAVLTADGDVVTAYNAGASLDGPRILRLAWTDGVWSVSVCMT